MPSGHTEGQLYLSWLRACLTSGLFNRFHWRQQLIDVTVSVERERKQGDIVTFLVSFVVFRRRQNKLAPSTVLLVPISEMPGSELGQNTNFQTQVFVLILSSSSKFQDSILNTHHPFLPYPRHFTLHIFWWKVSKFCMPLTFEGGTDKVSLKSVTNYQLMLWNTKEERKAQLYGGRSL